jgi:hypothetical protein
MYLNASGYIQAKFKHDSVFASPDRDHPVITLTRRKYIQKQRGNQGESIVQCQYGIHGLEGGQLCSKMTVFCSSWDLK